MSNWNDFGTILFRGIYFDPEAIGEDFGDMTSEHMMLSEILYVLLMDGLINVYWTNDDKFYLESTE